MSVFEFENLKFMVLTNDEIYSAAKSAALQNYPTSDRRADFKLGFIEGADWTLKQKLHIADVSGALPLALSFHQWMINKGWTKHSSGEYYYRSKDFHQWPPDETATEDELLKMFGGNDR